MSPRLPFFHMQSIRTRGARGCSWMFSKAYFLNFRYFFIAKKQEIAFFFISPIERLKTINDQPGAGHLSSSSISSPPLGICQFSLKKAYAQGLAQEGGGVLLKKGLCREAPLRGPTPYPFINLFFLFFRKGFFSFFQKRHPFRIPFICKRVPLLYTFFVKTGTFLVIVFHVARNKFK